MAQAVFASLLIGLIFKTIGEQGINLFGENAVCEYLIELGSFAMKLVGPAIGVSVAWGLGAPPLVLFSSTVSGWLGANAGARRLPLFQLLSAVNLCYGFSVSAKCASPQP